MLGVKVILKAYAYKNAFDTGDFANAQRTHQLETQSGDLRGWFHRLKTLFNPFFVGGHFKSTRR